MNVTTNKMLKSNNKSNLLTNQTNKKLQNSVNLNNNTTLTMKKINCLYY